MQAKMQVFASLGSMGIWVRRRPKGVKASPPSSAPREVRERTAETTAVSSGGVSILLKTSRSLWSGPNLVLTVRQSCSKGVRHTSGACCAYISTTTIVMPLQGSMLGPIFVLSAQRCFFAHTSACIFSCGLHYAGDPPKQSLANLIASKQHVYDCFLLNYCSPIVADKQDVWSIVCVLCAYRDTQQYMRWVE